MKLDFEVKRARTSVTQQEAHVYCNGEFVAIFADTPKMIQNGEKYYGPIIGKWASTTPDAKFIHAVLFHKHDDLYHLSDGIKKILSRAMEEEINDASVGNWDSTGTTE